MYPRNASVVCTPNLSGRIVAFEGFSSPESGSASGLPAEVSPSSPLPHFRLGDFPHASGSCGHGEGEWQRKGPRNTGPRKQEKEEIPAVSRNQFHFERGDKSCRSRNRKH